MNTNLNSQIPSPRSLTGEGLAAAVAIMGSALLVAKRFFAAKPHKPEPMSRADFYAELVVLKRNEVAIRSLRFLLFSS